MTRTIARLALVAVLGTGTPSPRGLHVRDAHAEDAATRSAKRYFERGEKLFALGKFEDALEQYQKAFDAKPIPALLFNIGQCHRNLDDYEAAIFSFKKYLRLEPEAQNREDVEDLIAELEKKQQKGEARRLRVDRKRATDPDPSEEPARGGAPVYKQWWFWTAIGVGVAGGVGVYAATRPSGPPDTALGNIVLPPK